MLPLMPKYQLPGVPINEINVIQNSLEIAQGSGTGGSRSMPVEKCLHLAQKILDHTKKALAITLIHPQIKFYIKKVFFNLTINNSPYLI